MESKNNQPGGRIFVEGHLTQETMVIEQHNRLEAHDGKAYLRQLELLRAEMNDAILAISGNSLQALEESLWRQEVLCVSLKRLLQSLHDTRIDSAILVRMQSATTALHTVNQSYAGLIQRSRSSADLLYGLCRSYSEASSHEDGSTSGAFRSFEA